MSTSKKKRPAAVRSTEPSRRPWVIGGVDYGPAISAVTDLAAWAFELAAQDVKGWPEGRRRVLSAKRYVLSRLQGKHVVPAATEDVLFAAGLLARIFEADLNLGMTDMVSILDQLGLPTEVVPLSPRPQGRRRNASNVIPFRSPPPVARAEPEHAGCPGCPFAIRLRSVA